MKKIILMAIMAVSLSSCHIYKKYQTPDSTPLTKEYKEAVTAGEDSTSFGALRWEQVFKDPVLAALIDRALANNTNLRNAQLNVEAARAQLLGAKLAYFPSLALAPNGSGAKYGNSSMGWSYQIPAQASWEIDIFAKLLNGKRSAKAKLMQSEAYAQAVRSQIIAGVATTYYTLQAVYEQYNLSVSTSELWKETVQTLRDLKEAGRTTEPGVLQAEASYYSICGSITDLEATIDQLNNTMSLLLNEKPQTWTMGKSQVLAMPKLGVGNGVEMRWLAARPDVASAEQALAVAYYATNSARANFYPSINVSANGGFTNLLGGMIKNPGEWFVNLAGSLTAPLFSRGRNIAALKAAKASQQAALNTFEYTLLSAAAEVSDALTTYEKSREKSVFLDLQVADMDVALKMTKDLFKYSTGDVDYLQVINAQQSLLQAQISRIATTRDANLAIINLYQSLGGGK